MWDLVSKFDETCENAEIYFLLVINLQNLIENFPSSPNFKSFKTTFTEYALSLVSQELKEEVIQATLETYPDFVEEDEVFMSKTNTIGIQNILTENVYNILCNHGWKFNPNTNMSIIVGIQPNIMRGRLMGYEQSDLTSFGGRFKKGESPLQTALRELKEEGNIDHKRYRSKISLVKGTTYCFEILEELQV
eukprot:TRINITY_DN20164_c0_g1_i1.p1 TRINITY_DN20164_c0_g1~~TRINITY_DN20164_c0_g1_i1.p1  ORF type:complete len:191 (-),score=26.64 TRINITY_DN20164_c0_g1_i1:114-686(-)